MTKLDSNHFNYNIALFPHTVRGNLIEVNIDFHCHRGIQNQRPVWGPMLNEEIVGLVTPDQAAYAFLKYQLINRMEQDFNYPTSPTTIASCSFNDPSLHPMGMAYDERGLVNSAVHALISGNKLPGLSNNVALKPSDLHLFLEFLQKFVAFSSVFIYH